MATPRSTVVAQIGKQNSKQGAQNSGVFPLNRFRKPVRNLRIIYKIFRLDSAILAQYILRRE